MRFKPTRVGRAIVALCLCLGLVASFIWNRNEVEAAQEKLSVGIVSTSWKISEMIYEAEQLAQLVLLHTFDDLPLEDLQVQFDVFWSRVEVLDSLELTQDGALSEAVQGLLQLLNDMDPLLYADTAPSHDVLFGLRDRLDEEMVKFRQAWSLKNNSTGFDKLSPITATMSRQKRQFENISALIIGAIICYLFMELFLSSLATKREKILTRAANDASRTKSQFIANVSHEIRTPLNGILGTAALLSETELSREQTEYVNVLEQAGGLLLSTINDVLDFSKLEAGEFAIHNDEFNLNDLFGAARGLYEPLAVQKSLTLALESEGDIPPLFGDHRRLGQVLHNLISNAVKFTDTGGVKVHASFEPDISGGMRSGLYIRVRDTGIGIRAEEQARVFDPFGQSSADLSRSHGGTGLGLTISRDLCAAMGGELSMQSEFGEGTEFLIYVPFTKAEPRSDVPQESDVSDAEIKEFMQTLSILIVDDTRTNRFILSKFLRPLGCEIAEAESGQAALDYASSHHVDVILMDVQMPGMDGIEATREILKTYGLHNRTPPCIFGVTANVLQHQIDSYIAAGMSLVISKPVAKPALVDAIRKKALRSMASMPEIPASYVA